MAEFRNSSEAAEVGPLDADRVARLIVDFAATRDPGELIRVSPLRWEAFLSSSSLRGGEDTFAQVVRAWSAWASRQAGMPLLARDELATALTRCSRSPGTDRVRTADDR